MARKTYFLRIELDLEYFVQAAKKLLKHDRCYGDRVVVMGQSKGGDLALALGKGNYSIQISSVIKNFKFKRNFNFWT